jgi:hypothetical protein
MIRRRFFEDSKSNHGIAEEKQEICMDREMWKHFKSLKSC